jgi:hypothetical protein
MWTLRLRIGGSVAVKSTKGVGVQEQLKVIGPDQPAQPIRPRQGTLSGLTVRQLVESNIQGLPETRFSVGRKRVIRYTIVPTPEVEICIISAQAKLKAGIPY